MVFGVVLGTGLADRAAGQLEDNLRDRLSNVGRAEAEYAVRHWTVADGLPGQHITAIAQTPDGYLWCGTDDALVRYDGARFRTFFAEEVPELDGVGIVHLSCDREGRLWIWGGKKDLVVMEDGRFRKIGVADGWDGESVTPVMTGRGGDFWFVGGPGAVLHRFRDGRFDPKPYPLVTGPQDAVEQSGLRLDAIWADADGPRWGILDRVLQKDERWAGNRDRRLVRMTPEGVENVEVRGRGPQFELEVLFTLLGGTAALGSRDGIYVARDGEWALHHRFDQPIARNHGALLAIEQDVHGNYWIATNDGGLLLSEADRSTRQFVLPEEERRPTIRSLCLDRSGCLWVGSRDGLYQIVRKAARSWGRAEGMPEDEVRAVAEAGDGRIWFASEEALVSLSPDGVLGDPQFVPRDDLVQRAIIERLAPSADGSLWVALRSFRIETQRWHHELLRAKDGGFVFVTALAQPVTSLHEAGDGTMLVGTIDGLFSWNGRTLEEVDLAGLRKERWEQAHIASLTDDGEGRVVAAVLTAGLFRREGGGWQRLTDLPAEDRQARNVWALSVGRDGTIWVGCGRSGLACWNDGTWKSFTDLKARLPREITGVAADEMGGLWLTSTTGEGLVRLDCGELLQWWHDRTVDPTVTHFGRQDGLPSIVAQSGYSPVCRDREGRIWIATKLGAAVLRPEEWKRRRATKRPPEVHLQEVRVNDRLVSQFNSGVSGGTALRDIVVPPGPRRVEFRYIGIDLASPEEVRYRYRLEGYEGGWTEAGERAVAVYPDLPPGRYVFRVAAAGRYGLWNEQGAGATLTVLPLWWERTTTRVVAVLLVLGLLTLAYIYRLSQIKAKTRMQEEFSRALIWSQEAERKRLASELHDGLGHELLVLKGGIDRELKHGAADAATGSALSAKAREVINRVREISHDLRPPELERYGIGPALESLALATAELTGIELVIQLDPPARRLRPVVEISLFRIAQEALSNMARHSDASEGSVVLSHAVETITLVIEDDGRGFDPAGVERTRGGPGLGLSGMEERAHLLGGAWECKSEAGKGTRMTVVLPLLYRV